MAKSKKQKARTTITTTKQQQTENNFQPSEIEETRPIIIKKKYKPKTEVKLTFLEEPKTEGKKEKQCNTKQQKHFLR